MSIRKRRRDRTRNRIANQKRLDAIAITKINKSFVSSLETWGGTVCPNCYKRVPARALLARQTIPMDNGIIRLGASILSQYCHRNVQKCASESAKADKWMWMQSPLYQEQNHD